MSAPAAAAASAGGGPASHLALVTALVARVRDGLPLASRWLLTLQMVFLLPTLLPISWVTEPLVDSAAFCVAPLLNGSASPLLQFFRFVLSPLLHTELTTGLLSCFAFYALCPRIEQQRGTAALLTLSAALLLLTQLTHTLLVALLLSQPSVAALLRDTFYLRLDASYPSERLHIPLLGADPATLSDVPESAWRRLLSFSIPMEACVVNSYAIVFALIVVETGLLTRDNKRHVFLLPSAVPTRMVPLLLFAAYQVWSGFQLHTVSGLLTGYAVVALPALALWSPMLLRPLERASWRRRLAFIPLERAGKMQPWAPAVVDNELAAVAVPTASTISRSASGSMPQSRAGRTPPSGNGSPTVASTRRPVVRGVNSGIGAVAISSGAVAARAPSPAVVRASPPSDSDEEEELSPSAALKAASPPSPSLVGRSVSGGGGAGGSGASGAAERPSAQLAANVARILQPTYPLPGGKQQLGDDDVHA